MNSKWNPNQYEKFKEQRAQPFYDLMSLIEKNNFNQAIDLGCGTGELSRVLFDNLKPTNMIAVDSSPEMLLKAEKFKTQNLKFELTDISNFQPKNKFDLIFSNAALQWLPNHEQLFSKILNWVSSGGQVAIQMPLNFDHPSHTIAQKVANELFPSIFKKQTSHSVLPIERYSEIFYQNGFQTQIARIEVYGHPMKSGAVVVEWTKGTLLTGYKSKLTETEFTQFLNLYTSELIEKIGKGPYLYTFKRALLWGKKND